MQNDDPNEYYGDITVDDGRSSSAAGRGATSSASSTSSGPSSTITSMANVAATTAARLLRRADDDDQAGKSTWTDKDLDYGNYAGNGYWDDDYTPQMRWTAVGVLLGVLVAAWLPWIYVSIRVSAIAHSNCSHNRMLTLPVEQPRYHPASEGME